MEKMMTDKGNLQVVRKNQKELRTGYTTGSCAAAAAKAAARMLLSGNEVTQVALRTPKGVQLYLDIEEISRTKDWVSCAVKKDSGDDPDVTNGVYVYAKVQRKEGTRITLEGGKGIGRVTRKGFSQAVGEAAINPVPRQMILEAAVQAPTAGNQQLYTILDIQDPRQKAALVKTCDNQPFIAQAKLVLIFCADCRKWYEGFRE